MITENEFDVILSDPTKRIKGNIGWVKDEQHVPACTFRVAVSSQDSHVLEVVGRWNPKAGKLSYVLLYRGLGRIYALDLGSGHRNPNGDIVGDTHKHSWSDEFRDKCAYMPEDITARWDQPVEVWIQFCNEARISHDGTLTQPHWQKEFDL